jgi:glyoxylase-like metal-dependent hydrolase (beta-lactamase superfamily II)
MTELTRSFHIVDGVTFEYSPGVKSIYRPTLILGKSGIVLIDTGMPNSTKMIESYLRKIGHDLSEINQIILTHLDSDHIGSAPALRKETGAKVVMHKLDAALSTDKSINIKNLKKMFPDYGGDEIDRLMEKISGTRDLDLIVDQKLDDAETQIAIDGRNFSIIHTPGHTPGHCCVYSQQDSLLVSGDGLTVKNGTVQDPPPMYTVSMLRARASLKKLGGLSFERLVSYHDEPLLSSSSKKLKEYLQLI